MQESPQAPEGDDVRDGQAQSSMTPDTEHVLWQLLVGDTPPGDEAEETRS